MVIGKLIGLLTALVLLAGCAGGDGNAKAPYDPAAVAGVLLDSGGFTEQLERLDADLVVALYGLETTPEDAVVYTSTGATAEEFAVLNMADEAGAKAALEALKIRLADQKDACQGYLPAEIPKLDGAILDRRGRTVLLVVTADGEKARAALDELDK